MNFEDKAAAVEELSLSAQPGDGTLRSTDVAHVSLKRLHPEAPSGHPSERRLLLKVTLCRKKSRLKACPGEVVRLSGLQIYGWRSKLLTINNLFE